MIAAKQPKRYQRQPVILTTKAIHIALCKWHAGLYDNRGTRAELRRAATPEEVMLTTGFREVVTRLSKPGRPLSLRKDGNHRWFKFPKDNDDKQDDSDYTAAATIAGILSHVKHHIPGDSFAKQLGSPKEHGGKTQRMSPLRFQRLQKSHSWHDFYQQLLHAVRLLGSSVNIISLADDVFLWAALQRQVAVDTPNNRLLIRWADDYYTALSN